MRNESAGGMESDLLEKIRSSDTVISTRICTVRLEKVGSDTVEIRPRDVGTNTQGWSVNEIPVQIQTLETAIIVGMEIQARG